MYRAYVTTYHCGHSKLVPVFCPWALEEHHPRPLWKFYIEDPTTLPICLCKLANGLKLSRAQIVVFMPQEANIHLWQHVETTLIQPVRYLLETRANALNLSPKHNPGTTRKWWMVRKAVSTIKRWLKPKQKKATQPSNGVGRIPTCKLWAATVSYTERGISNEVAGCWSFRSTKFKYEQAEMPIKLVLEEGSNDLEVLGDPAELERWNLFLR